MLSVYSSEYLQTYALDVWELFFEKHLILDIQTTFTICKSFIAKNFWWNYNKNESFKPYFGTKEQKLFFLVVSQSDLRFEFDFANPVFLQIKLRAQKIGHVDVNLSSLALKCQREIAAENGMWLTHPSRLEYVLDC